MSAVTKHTLENGLTVLLKETHSAPVISWVVLYRIGSRNERTGQTGISHWVEHMMFKGTEKFPGGDLDKQIDRLGGSWNAFTSLDYTGYYETLPSDRIDLALELEADRMVNATFDPEELERERTVIISERHGAENSPLFWLSEEVNAAAFRVHGYHHEIIGDLTDLETMTRDDLYNHYKAHYMPNNAVAVAVGDFDSDEMLAKIKQHYADIPAGETPNLFVRPEPEQAGERRVRVERPGSTHFVMIGHRTPAATEDDWFALEVLDSVLTGPGGGVGNKTSRLYKALVQTELAAGIGGGLRQTIDPYLHLTYITVRDGQTPEACESAFDIAIDLVLNEGITEAELVKAKKQARAVFAYEQERVTSQAFDLAKSFNLGDYELAENFPERIEAVTMEDVRRVAQTYLQKRNRTVGYFIPTAPNGDE